MKEKARKKIRRTGLLTFFVLAFFISASTVTIASMPSASAATTPSAPQSVKATAGNGKVTLSWSAPASDGGSTISYYRIWRGATSSADSILTTRGNVLTWTDTSVTNGKTYYYKVAAINAVGVGAKSSAVSATPTATGATTTPPASSGVPSAPQNFLASAGNGKVTLTWSAPASNGGSAVTGYKVYRGTTSGGEGLLATLGNVLTYSNSGLTNGQTYYYKVAAVNAKGVGVMSEEKSATPTASPSSTTPSYSGQHKYVVTTNGVTHYVTSTATGKQVYSSTNPTKAIQWAIDHLTSGRTAKEKVLVRGTYKLSSFVNLASNTVVELDGKVSATSSLYYLFFAQDKRNIEIVGGTWDGSRLYSGASGACIYLLRCNNFVVSDCYMSDRGIYLNTLSNGAVKNNALSNAGITLTGSSFGIKITGNTVANTGAGIYLYCDSDGVVQKIYNCEVSGNEVKRVSRDGISLYVKGVEDVINDVLVSGNTLVDCGTDGFHPGIAVGTGGSTNPAKVGNVHHCTIQNNVVYETGTYRCGGGIHVRGDYNHVSKNTISNTDRPGLAIKNGIGNTFDYNTVNGGRGNGQPLLLLVGAVNNNIVGNTLKGPVRASGGISLLNSDLYPVSHGNIFTGNTVKDVGSGQYWVYIASGNYGNTFSGNTFSGTHYGTGIKDLGRGNIFK